MNKHTPAPWLIAENSKTFVYALNDKGTNVFFAHVQDAHTNKEELEANARLIAAAPELLEALQKVHQIIVEGSREGFNPLISDWATKLYESQYNTSNAIRKATGE